MADYMDNQKAADLLDNLLGMVEDNQGNDYNAALKMGIGALKAYTQPVQRWIPCDERMPLLDEYGYSQKVLVCFSNYSGCDICEYRKDEEQNGWYVGDSDDNPEDIGIHVVAWMPLPEPYKEEAQDD